MITVTNILEGDDAPDATPDWQGVKIAYSKVDPSDGLEWVEADFTLSPDEAKQLFGDLGNCIKAAEGAWG